MKIPLESRIGWRQLGRFFVVPRSMINFIRRSIGAPGPRSESNHLHTVTRVTPITSAARFTAAVLLFNRWVVFKKSKN